MARIHLENLPQERDLTQEELEQLYGAGPKRVTLGFDALEAREMMAANLTAAPLPPPSSVPNTQFRFLDSIQTLQGAQGGTAYALDAEGDLQKYTDTLGWREVSNDSGLIGKGLAVSRDATSALDHIFMQAADNRIYKFKEGTWADTTKNMVQIQAGKGKLYALDAANKLWVNDLATGAWTTPATAATLAGKALTVGLDNAGKEDVYIQAINDIVWRYDSTGKLTSTGMAMKTIVAGQGELFGIGADKRVWTWNTTAGWRSTTMFAEEVAVARLSGTGNDLAYARKADGTLHQWNGSAWTAVAVTGGPTKLQQLAAAQDTLYALDDTGKFWTHNLTTNKWTDTKQTGFVFSLGTDANGKPEVYLRDGTGKIWDYEGGVWKDASPEAAKKAIFKTANTTSGLQTKGDIIWEDAARTPMRGDEPNLWRDGIPFPKTSTSFKIGLKWVNQNGAEIPRDQQGVWMSAGNLGPPNPYYKVFQDASGAWKYEQWYRDSTEKTPVGPPVKPVPPVPPAPVSPTPAPGPVTPTPAPQPFPPPPTISPPNDGGYTPVPGVGIFPPCPLPENPPFGGTSPGLPPIDITAPGCGSNRGGIQVIIIIVIDPVSGRQCPCGALRWNGRYILHPFPLTNSGRQCHNPCAAINERGDLVFAWTEWNTVETVCMRTFSVQTRQWSPIITVSDPTLNCSDPSLAVTNNSIYIGYTVKVGQDENVRVNSHRIDGSFVGAIDLANTTDREFNCQIVTDSRGRAVISYEVYTPTWSCVMVRGYNEAGQKVWQKWLEDRTLGWYQGHCLSIDDNGYAVVAYKQWVNGFWNVCARPFNVADGTRYDGSTANIIEGLNDEGVGDIVVSMDRVSSNYVVGFTQNGKAYVKTVRSWSNVATQWAAFDCNGSFTLSMMDANNFTIGRTQMFQGWNQVYVSSSRSLV